MNRRCVRGAIVAFVIVATAVPAAMADVLTVEGLLKEKEKWPIWAREQTKLQITGRLRARVGSRLYLQQLDFVFVPDRDMTIPDRIRSGRRLTVSGRLVRADNEFEFHVTRFSLSATDREELAEALSRLEYDDVIGRYQLARRFARIADFYDDNDLANDVLDVRLAGIEFQRKGWRNKPEQLWTLVDPGPGFAIPDEIRQSLAYEVILRQSTDESVESLTGRLKKYLPGWNHTSSKLTDENLIAWKRNPSRFHDRADAEVRRQLERLLYRTVRAAEIRRELKPDGSNGLQLASQLREELPEEVDVARDMAGQYADHRLTSLDGMNRSRLREIVNVLNDVGREEDAQTAVDDWADLQASRFGDQGLEGQIRVADEYLFAWDQWKNASHRSAAIDYLKQAWETARKVAPDEVPTVASRLENLGWTRLHDRWLTIEELKNVPADDIEKAQREGRVVPGMTPQQVRRLLGEPSRRIRTASSRHVEELWVYGERHSSRITVRLRRVTAAPPADALVLDVFRLNTR